MTDPFSVIKGVKLPSGGRVRIRTKVLHWKGKPVQNSVFARSKGKDIGGFHLDRKDGYVYRVGVEPGYRRKGVATEMLNAAKRRGWKVKHAPVRTSDGDKWVASLSKAKTKPVSSALRMGVKELEERQGRLVRMGRKKNAPTNLDGKDLVDWVRRNRFS